ncbi:hypothetical protein EBB07_09240 [Paenibacillaceae bacterium]|nr:hypothetical protein EBB07_09240 [Paenibacillaceae bacterium]
MNRVSVPGQNTQKSTCKQGGDRLVLQVLPVVGTYPIQFAFTITHPWQAVNKWLLNMERQMTAYDGKGKG